MKVDAPGWEGFQGVFRVGVSRVGEFGIGGRGGWGEGVCARVCVSGERCSTMATISVRPPGEQMGYEPANEMRRKSGVFAPVRVSHAYAHTHASERRECVSHTRTLIQSCRVDGEHIY